jgi:hypothetical protein
MTSTPDRVPGCDADVGEKLLYASSVLSSTTPVILS